MTTLIVIIVIIVLLVFIFGSSKNKKPISNTDSVKFNIKTESSSKHEQIKLAGLEEKYPKWHSNKNTIGICFKSERIEPLPNGIKETVHYKTDRYTELFGRGKDCSYFPGYGRICNRTFTIWNQEVGSTERKGKRKYKDIANESYQTPIYLEDITNGIPVTNELSRTQGFIKLFNGRDEKKRKTWYAGLEHLEFTGIITTSEKE